MNPGPDLDPMTDKRLKLMRLRLSHPSVGFSVEATLTENEGRWLATAMLADHADIGTGLWPRQALRGALAALGEPYASELAGSAALP